jgi:hypothetical protein
MAKLLWHYAGLAVTGPENTTEYEQIPMHHLTRRQVKLALRLRKALSSTLLAFVACVGAGGLAGCAAGPHQITVAAAAGLSPAQVAVLSVVPRDEPKGYMFAMIQHVYDRAGHDLLNPDGGSRGTDRVTLLPGHYQVTLKVFGDYAHLDAYPRLLVRLEAGKTYNVAAMRAMDGRAIRPVYREVGAGPLHE